MQFGLTPKRSLTYVFHRIKSLSSETTYIIFLVGTDAFQSKQVVL